MYTPTEDERKRSINIVKEILDSSNDEYKRYSDEIFRIVYSVGGDYGEKTLRSIAEAIIKNKSVVSETQW